MFKFKKSMAGTSKEENFECSCCGSMEEQASAGAVGCSSGCGPANTACCAPVENSCCGPVSDSECGGSKGKPQDSAESNDKGSCNCSC